MIKEIYNAYNIYSKQYRVCSTTPQPSHVQGIVPRLLLTLKSHAVFPFTSSNVTPGASSISSNSPALRSTSKTARSVMMWLRQRDPVKGKEHSFLIFGLPSRAQCSRTEMTLVFSGFETRSIAPPIPLTTFPGIMKLARSPA